MTIVARNYLQYCRGEPGKDLCAWSWAIQQALAKTQVIFYVFPTYSQGKKAIWDSITNDGTCFMDYLNDDYVLSKNSQELKIKFTNGSVLQIVGSNNIDSLMGTNCQIAIFSEYALQSKAAFDYIRPILQANGGKAVLLSTPRGRRNHLYELYEIACKLDSWKVFKLTVEDTKHVSLEDVYKDRDEGLVSDNFIRQEWFTDFSSGNDQAYYGQYMIQMELDGRIGKVPWSYGHEVHTAWDLGVRDSTAIIFFQVIDKAIHIIDSYSNSKEGLEHYIEVIKSKKYSYGLHIAPHDIAVREFTSGVSRIEKAYELGIEFTIANKVSLMDGIEAVRSTLGRVWIDSDKATPLVRALEDYQQAYDMNRKVYSSQPLHSWSSHYADAMRYLCVSLNRLQKGLTPEQLNEQREQAAMRRLAPQGGIFATKQRSYY